MTDKIVETALKEIIEDVIDETEDMILELQTVNDKQPCFSNETFRASVFIFTTMLMDKMWSLQENEGLDSEDRLNMAQKAGEEIRRIIKTYTGLDSKKLC